MVFPAPSQQISKCIPAPVLKGPTVIRAEPRCGHTGQVNNLAPLKTNTFFKPGQGWQTFLSAHPQIAGNFWKNSYQCGNLNLRAPHFQVVQQHPSALFRLVPWVAAWLALIVTGY